MDEVQRPYTIEVVHDYFTQIGGAERVALQIADVFPEANLVTLCFDKENVFQGFPEYKTKTLVSRIPGKLMQSRIALALLAIVRFPMYRSDCDISICSSSGWSHLISGKKIFIYCYTPARWLYEPNLFFQKSYIANLAKVPLSILRYFDKKKAKNAYSIIAISTVVQERIRRTWGIEAPIIFPPIKFRRNDPQSKPSACNFKEKEYYLIVSRPRHYKNIEAAFEAFVNFPERNLIIVGEHTMEAQKNIQIIDRVSDSELSWLYSNARAVMAIAQEDFGLSPVEGHVFGTPTLALKSGGYLDTCFEGINAVFVQQIDNQSLREGLLELEAQLFSTENIVEHAKQFSIENFTFELRNHVLANLDGIIPSQIREE